MSSWWTIVKLKLQLNSGDPQIRARATYALGKTGDERAFAPVASKLKDQDFAVRKAAAEALGQIGDARAVALLIDALEDPVSQVCNAATEGLVAIGDAAVIPLIVKLKARSSGCTAVATALSRLGDARAVEPLIAAFEDDTITLRTVPLGALLKFGVAVQAPLVPKLMDQNLKIRKFAVEALWPAPGF